ncbi:hypothetical protein GH714_027828 [Hevea brasiliensis]|uniref:Disease resistance R13L4/SHOC-2-like LRR domain-containing protein n=1 Tax=Hevea brasiliensis TaxID=3981 RepID=A0A6A6NJJ1_HEVBR|nr:hypothetical protein GH714_027828 [Hevea brasiliensis]
MHSKSLRNSTKLRALLLMPSSEVVLDRHIGWFSSLRVLDFSLSKLDNISVEDFLVWICSLKRLAYLNLSGVSGIKELPSSIRKLRNLQLLILCGCSNLVRLNPYITTLKKLVVLDLGSCGLEYLPKGLGRLFYLQELSGFKISNQANKQSCRLHELREFYLRRYRHKTLPTWINPEQLSSLQYLCIENGDLTHIETRPQHVADSLYTWNIEGLCFKVLPSLKVDWKNLEQDMPLLRYAEVSGCFNLQNFPRSDDKLVVWRKNED